MITLVADDEAVILKAQLAQLENPARTTANSEHAFVTQRLQEELKRPDLARIYWNSVCMSFCTITNERITHLQRRLDELDRRQRVMPEWYGA